MCCVPVDVDKDDDDVDDDPRQVAARLRILECRWGLNDLS